MRWTRGTLIAVVAALAAALLAPASGSASQVIGSNLSTLSPTGTISRLNAPSETLAPDVQLLVNPYIADTASGGLVAAAPGVVTQFRLKTQAFAIPMNSQAGALSFRILTWGGGMATDTFTGAPIAPAVTPDNTVSGIQSFPVRVPILAGQTIGVDLPPASVATSNYYAFSYNPNNVNRSSFLQPALADGAGPTGFTQLQSQSLLDATIEPDADHDLYGDETQDLCPTNPTTQAACPQTKAPPPVSHAAKRCKKKKGAKRHASSAKKRCKKKKKKSLR